MTTLNRRLDILFVEPDSSAKAYQDLSKTYSAIETPTWSLLLAQSCRRKGFGVAILDCNAEHLTDEQAIQRIRDVNPRLVCFVLYGQNPNSGTTSMIGGTRLCAELKQAYPEYLTCFVGSHVSALPREVLSHPFIDMVLLNEGVYALHDLLRSDLNDDLDKINGIGYKRDGHIVLNPPQQVVPQQSMDNDLPGYAWDLLPYDKKPLDLYRAHFWHTNYNHEQRTPFAALYTSLGCPFKCDFCMINILNRVDNSDEVTSANSSHIRYWTPELILREFDKLVEMGVQTIRISDEMFFLNKRHFEPLIKGLIERDYDLRLWAYTRVDTIKPEYLDIFRQAGIKWLAIGFEAGNQLVRQEVSKGKFNELDIREIVKSINDHGINVAANYIFGFPGDNFATMQQTLDLACELNTPFANFYPCMALPGSPLYLKALQNGWKLPDSYEGYAFFSDECLPLPTKYLSAADVLKFRDEAWHKYYTRTEYLDLIERKFGKEQRKNIEELTKIKIKRKILGD
ncbi:radical SAM protein [Candidatus Parcubacteria bacterium]|nr:MAG: radical SAM protein [Candidatus Parcubacteria bacterium]